MRISIITLFPQMFSSPFEYSIIKRAIDKNLVELNFVNIRDFGIGKHKVVDDTIYGGGIGLVMRVDVIHQAIEYTKLNKGVEKVVLLKASGILYTQEIANKLSKIDHLILLCGHYEGIDERIKEFVDLELSIGDFVLTGGEIPAMLIIDSISRLIPGVLKDDATNNESFSIKSTNLKDNLLEYPQYTKPPIYKKRKVPKVLLSGNHQEINKWREENSLKITRKNRPDLLKVKLKKV